MKVVIYQADDGWRWRLIARNGLTLGDSGEAYTRKDDAYEAARRIQNEEITSIEMEADE